MLEVSCIGPCAPGSPCNCPWDMNNSGSVDIVDFPFLLGARGPNPRSPADFNCDGVVNVQDFLAFLGNWGASPDRTAASAADDDADPSRLARRGSTAPLA